MPNPNPLRLHHAKGGVPRDYDDDYLDLVHLLTGAATLEHALLVAYLYALFAIKPEHVNVRGDIAEPSYLRGSPFERGGTDSLKAKTSFLDVALEEMQHLSIVNWFLVELGASPNFIPPPFPFVSDLYPFPLDLRPLDRFTAATYLWVEAGPEKFGHDRTRQGQETAEVTAAVVDAIRSGMPGFNPDAEPDPLRPADHVGSVYRRILQQLHRVADNRPDFLPATFPWGDWENRIEWILHQGEETHYQFFRKVFTGEAFGLGNDTSDVGRFWEQRDDPRHPVRAGFARRSAYAGLPNGLCHPEGSVAHQLAWLADLHYWIILALLDLAYRSNTRGHVYKAIDQMTLGLWRLGVHLAEAHNAGIPFDPMGPHYTLGRNDRHSAHVLTRLVREARSRAHKLGPTNLPQHYQLELFDLTLDHLDHLSKPGVLGPDNVEFRFG